MVCSCLTSLFVRKNFIGQLYIYTFDVINKTQLSEFLLELLADDFILIRDKSTHIYKE